MEQINAIHTTPMTPKVYIELLGYKIDSSKGNKNQQGFFSLSNNKKQRIKERIKKTFEEFNRLLDSVSYDVAAHYLFDALHVLTCNINLYNAKRGVKVGIFYSNAGQYKRSGRIRQVPSKSM